MSLIQNEDLNVLVQELSKKNPNAELVKNKTDVLGIPYSPDLIVLMSEVLVFLSQNDNKKSYMKDKLV
ncbi:MAG: hypothetical protein H7061_12860 [Bdellovibrionaceae bacterium]|nr:hypothetical protein [Bdellovibrio sp.]